MLKKITIILAIIIFLSIFLICFLSKTNTYIKKLGDYKNLSFSNIKIDISEIEVEEEIKYKLRNYSYPVEINDRSIQLNDCVVFNYTMILNGKTVYENEPYEVEIGTGDFLLDIENKMVGHAINDKLILNIKFPKDYIVSDYQNQYATFYITIENIYIIDYPELTDIFVRDNLGYENLKDFYDHTKEDIYNIKHDEEEENLKLDLLQQIINNTQFNNTVNELYKQKYDELYNSYVEYSKIYNLDIQECLNMFELDIKTIQDNATIFIKRKLVIDSIRKKENLNLSPDEYNKLAQEYILKIGYDDITEFINDNGEEFLSDEIYQSYIMDYIYNLNNKKD